MLPAEGANPRCHPMVATRVVGRQHPALADLCQALCRESNRLPLPYHGSALPTELRGRGDGGSGRRWRFDYGLEADRRAARARAVASGNVEFLARTADTPRFTFGIIDFAPGRELEQHVHDDEDDSFFILQGELTFLFGDESQTAGPGTFVFVPPGVRHGFRNDSDVRGTDASTSTRPAASTGESG